MAVTKQQRKTAARKARQRNAAKALIAKSTFLHPNPNFALDGQRHKAVRGILPPGSRIHMGRVVNAARKEGIDV